MTPEMRLGCFDFCEKGPIFLRSYPIENIIFEYDFARNCFSLSSFKVFSTLIGFYPNMGVGDTAAVFGRVPLTFDAAFLRPSSNIT